MFHSELFDHFTPNFSKTQIFLMQKRRLPESAAGSDLVQF